MAKCAQTIEDPILATKFRSLKSCLAELGSVAVAFSGGVDSTLLAKVAHCVLGGDAIAVTARSRLFPEREFDEAVAFCAREGIKHIFFESEELKLNDFLANPKDRCYICKSSLLLKIRKIAAENGVGHVIDGSNTDDLADYRPGMTAVKEQGVVSPLCLAKLDKQEIRAISKTLGLPTWDKPGFACLASRVPYGEPITTKKISAVGEAEQFLLDMGLKQVRVRHHGALARIETDEDGFAALFERGAREKIQYKFVEIGFTYVTLDIIGYRTGSMNETLHNH